MSWRPSEDQTTCSSRHPGGQHGTNDYGYGPFGLVYGGPAFGICDYCKQIVMTHPVMPGSIYLTGWYTPPVLREEPW